MYRHGVLSKSQSLLSSNTLHPVRGRAATEEESWPATVERAKFKMVLKHPPFVVEGGRRGREEGGERCGDLDF